MILIVKHVLIEGSGVIGQVFAEEEYFFKTVELEHGEKLPEELDIAGISFFDRINRINRIKNSNRLAEGIDVLNHRDFPGKFSNSER